MKTKSIFYFALILLTAFAVNITFAHCDTMEGPVVADAKKAIEHNNVNYVLKWIKADEEKEVIDAFTLTMKVRNQSTDAKELADKYFFETLVRIHRNGEGVPYTGIKPYGTPIDKKIAAADKAIEIGDLAPLKSLVSAGMLPELTKLFEKVMSLKNFDVNNVAAGREYVEAYVQFFHYAEQESEGCNHKEKSVQHEH